MESKFNLWCINENDLNDLKPKKARDIIVECFCFAQKETLEISQKKIGLPIDSQDIKIMVIGAIKAVFDEVKADFYNPTKNDLKKVVGILASKANSWGTPETIINHHKDQIEKMLNLIKD